MARIAHVLGDKWRSSDIRTEEDVTFSSLLLSDKVLHGLKYSGFVCPSPIQYEAIPLGRSGLDLIIQAKSGTGKTCVFAVVALEKLLLESKATQALVLAPTREVAVQICQVVCGLGVGFKGLECHPFIGGLPLAEDKLKLKKCHIAVGTPGRIKQLIKEDILKTNSVRLFVLDEADKLLEEGFQETINWIYSSLPVRKQMLAVSATYPEKLAELLQLYMRNPIFISLSADCPTLLGIAEFYCSTPYNPMQHICFESKINMLLKILKTVPFSQCLVFSNYQTRAESLCDVLKKSGWPAEYISGGQEQNQRLRAIDKLKQFKCRVLVSTDVSSRGIDAENVNLVVNMDIPWDLETYLHRIGRAGRFGTKGLSVTLLSGEEETVLFHKIRESGNLQVSVLPDPMPACLWTYANQVGGNCQTESTNEHKGAQESPENSDRIEYDQMVQAGCSRENDQIADISSHNILNHSLTNHNRKNESIASNDNQEKLCSPQITNDNQEKLCSPQITNDKEEFDTTLSLSLTSNTHPQTKQSPTDIFGNLDFYLKGNLETASALAKDVSVSNTASCEFLKSPDQQRQILQNFKEIVFSYEDLMNDFDKSLEQSAVEDQTEELAGDNNEEMQLLLSLNSFLASNHEEYRLKLQNELGKCNDDDNTVQTNNGNAENCLSSQSVPTDDVNNETDSRSKSDDAGLDNCSEPPVFTETPDSILPKNDQNLGCNDLKQLCRQMDSCLSQTEYVGVDCLSNRNVAKEPLENVEKGTAYRGKNSTDGKWVLKSTRNERTSGSGGGATSRKVNTEMQWCSNNLTTKSMKSSTIGETHIKSLKRNQIKNSSKHRTNVKSTFSNSSDESSCSEPTTSTSDSDNSVVHSVRGKSMRCTCRHKSTSQSWWMPSTRMALVYLEYQDFMTRLIHTYRREKRNGAL